MFLEKGYGGTRVQDIARKAGFTSGALYVHFPSRTALLGEAIIREGRTIMAGLAEQLGAGADGLDAVASLVSSLSTGEPSRLDLLLVEALALASRSEDAKVVLEAAMNDLVETLMAQISTARERGEVDAALDTTALRQVLVAWIFGGVVVKALGAGPAAPEQLDTVHRRLLGGLAAGR